MANYAKLFFNTLEYFFARIFIALMNGFIAEFFYLFKILFSRAAIGPLVFVWVLITKFKIDGAVVNDSLGIIKYFGPFIKGIM